MVSCSGVELAEVSRNCEGSNYDENEEAISEKGSVVFYANMAEPY